MGRFIGADGVAKVRLISPGQGTSAFYKEEQLRRDGSAFEKRWDEAKGGFVGGLVFLDHPGKKEQKDRPERSLRDLVGPVVGVPSYDENGPRGPGLYGKVRVAPWWRPLIEEFGDDIGVSIRANGSAVTETINGRKTKVAERFSPGATFDFVTYSGRGGRPSPMLEAATAKADKAVASWMASTQFIEGDGRSDAERFIDYMENGQEGTMGVQEQLTEAQGQVTTLTTERDALLKENKRMAEAIALRDARDKITEAVNDKKYEKLLPDVTKTRLIEALTKRTPMKDGKLDEAALTALIDDAIKAEAEYVESLTAKKPGVRGMGEGGEAKDDEGRKRLMETKTQEYLRQGKSEEDAKQMARLFCEGR
jgi:hypothetical protein